MTSILIQFPQPDSRAKRAIRTASWALRAPEVFVTCSVGVSVFPTDGSDADTLMRNAGLALRHAKQAGPHRYEYFSPRMVGSWVRYGTPSMR